MVKKLSILMLMNKLLVMGNVEFNQTYRDDHNPPIKRTTKVFFNQTTIVSDLCTLGDS